MGEPISKADYKKGMIQSLLNENSGRNRKPGGAEGAKIKKQREDEELAIKITRNANVLIPKGK